MSQEVNSEKYRFSDFTHRAYEDLLIKAKQNYKFVLYPEFKFDQEGQIVWRHDIDFSVHRALDLAKIEAKMDVRATYFIWIHSNHYNFLEKEIFEILNEIRHLGHELALHFDLSFYGDFRADINDLLANEKQVLMKTFEQDIRVFSFHNPTEYVLSHSESEISGMINSYSANFKNEVAYCSDSNGIWRHLSIDETLEMKPKNIQILTHPVWWSKDVKSPKERAWGEIEERAERSKDIQLKIWKEWSREFVD